MSFSAEDVLEMHADLITRHSRSASPLATWYLERMEDHWDDPRGPDMFAPVTQGVRKPSLSTAIQVVLMIGASLQDAVTYQVTAEMVEVMRATYDKGMKEASRLEEAELPSDRGFVVLDTAWELIDSDGRMFRTRACSWSRVVISDTETGLLRPAVRVTLWSHVDDELIDGPISPADYKDMRQHLGQLFMVHTAIVPFGLPIIIGTDDPAEVKATEAYLWLVHMLWIYLGMEIVTTRQQRVSRPVRRRLLAQGSIRHDTVNVVILRRIAHVTDPAPGSHEPVDWSCRWPVQGHYRHLDEHDSPHHAIATGADKHCAVCGSRLAWVRPYLKGPDGKPLKVSRTLMRLAR